MTSDERKEKVAELRKFHEPTFAALNIPDAYFVSKFPHVPQGMITKHIGLYQSECNRGDDVYIECCDMNYIPLDERRMLYVWRHDSNFAQKYEMKKDQFLIPVSDLHVVNPIHDVREYPVSWKKVVLPFDSTPEDDYVIKLLSKVVIKEETIKYEGKNGTVHTIVLKDGVPESYFRMPKTENIIDGFHLRGDDLLELVAIFKNINTKEDETK